MPPGKKKQKTKNPHRIKPAPAPTRQYPLRRRIHAAPVPLQIPHDLPAPHLREHARDLLHVRRSPRRDTVVGVGVRARRRRGGARGGGGGGLGEEEVADCEGGEGGEEEEGGDGEGLLLGGLVVVMVMVWHLGRFMVWVRWVSGEMDGG